MPVDSNMYWQQILSKLFGAGNQIVVPKTFVQRMALIEELLDNDKTGLVSTIYEFMVGTASVPYNFVTDNTNLTNTLNFWATYELNKNVNIDIPTGLRALSTQYFRERWKSSLIVLNIAWGDINGMILPTHMWFTAGSAIEIDTQDSTLNNKKYYINSLRDENLIVNSENKNTLIRKPFNSWYDDYPTPYLVKKGVVYNYLLKKTLLSKQADLLEEIIPYLLMLKAGDSSLALKNMMGDIEGQLTALKDSIKTAKRDKKYRLDAGDMIMKARYDVQLEHLIPDLTKLFNENIIKPINNDILAGLGLIELTGFSSDRQEAILNPKVLVEEITTGVLDLKALYEDVLALIIEKNSELHPKHMGTDMRIIPGVIKAFLTDNMRKLIKDYTNTGELAIQDSFEALPIGFDFEISKKRRQNEADNGDEDLFFPRVILNQDANIRPDTMTRTPTPQEVPQKNTKNENAEEVIAPYENIDELPSSIKETLPIAAQIIFIKAFNNAVKEGNSEENCFKIAWSAVKNKYEKKNDKWIKKSISEDASIMDNTSDDINKTNEIKIQQKKLKLLNKLLGEKDDENL